MLVTFTFTVAAELSVITPFPDTDVKSICHLLIAYSSSCCSHTNPSKAQECSYNSSPQDPELGSPLLLSRENPQRTLLSPSPIPHLVLDCPQHFALSEKHRFVVLGARNLRSCCYLGLLLLRAVRSLLSGPVPASVASPAPLPPTLHCVLLCP